MAIAPDRTAQPIAENALGRDLKLGVVGCGYWGPKLARNFSELSGSTLDLVCDLRDDRLAEMSALYPQVRTTKRHEDLLQGDLDAIAVCTPVKLHYALARAALMAGKHVLVEKPITVRADEARELIALAEDKGLTLMVGHTFVYNPAVESVRRIVQSGELGTIYYLNSTRVNLGLLQPDINVIWDLAPHDLSILLYVLGTEPVSVCAHGAAYVNTSRNLPEVAYVLVRFGDGAIANLRLSWLDPVKKRNTVIVGSKKMLVYDDLADHKVIVFDKGVEVPPYSVTEDEFRASYRHGGETAVPVEWIEPLRVECAHFLECIRTGATPRSSGQAGLRVLQILEAAQQSLTDAGAEVKVAY